IPGTTTPPDILAQLPPNASSQLGPATIGFEEDLYFVKFDYSPTDLDRFEISAKVRDETALRERTGTGTAASASVDTDNDDKRYELSWKHDGDGWNNGLYATYEDAFYVPHVINADQNGSLYTFNDGLDRNIIAID